MTLRRLVADALRTGADRALDLAHEREETPSALPVAFFAGVVALVADLIHPSEALAYDDLDPFAGADDLADDDAQARAAGGAALDGLRGEGLGRPTPPTREDATVRLHTLDRTTGGEIGRSIDADIAALCAAHGVTGRTWFDPDGRAVHWRLERGDRFVTRMISERDLCAGQDPHAFAMELMRADLAEIEGGLN